MSLVHPPVGVPPSEHVAVPASSGQSAAVVHVLVGVCAHRLMSPQLPPGFGHTLPLYLHLPTDRQSLSEVHPVPVTAQMLL